LCVRRKKEQTDIYIGLIYSDSARAVLASEESGSKIILFYKEDYMSDFEVKGVHHLGFVVKDLDSTLKKWEALFGQKAKISVNPDLQVRLGSILLGNVKFVFNESTAPGSRWEKYIEKNGEGLEHIALEVDDIESATGAANKAGLELRFDKHKDIHGLLTNFVENMVATDVEFMGPHK
jgi:methylmalonyl-CoA/ethylmalonyl-CoA epimerase